MCSPMARSASRRQPPPARVRLPLHLPVLLCEDDAIIRMTTAGMLEDNGLTVIETATAKEALAALPTGHIDIVVTDIGLPDMMGMDLVRKLRELLPDIPVLLATGARDVPGFDTLSNAAILTKPYDESALMRAITQLVVERG